MTRSVNPRFQVIRLLLWILFSGWWSVLLQWKKPSRISINPLYTNYGGTERRRRGDRTIYRLLSPSVRSELRRCLPMECMRPLSTLALSRLDMASTVQWRRDARRLDMPRLRPGTCCPSSSGSLQSFSRFIKSVKYLMEGRLFAGIKAHATIILFTHHTLLIYLKKSSD